MEKNKKVTITFLVPLSEMFGYADRLRSITKGQGTFTMRPAGYQEVPKKVLKKLLDQ